MHHKTTILFGRKSLILLLPVLFLLSTCSDQITDSGPGNENGDGKGTGNGVPDRSGNLKGVGDSAHDLLSDENFGTLIVQIQYMEGAEPTEDALAGLEVFLENRVHKSDIDLRVGDPISSGGKEKYTIQEIIDLEDDHRTEFNRSDTLAVYFLYVDGGSSQDQNGSYILGAAYRNTSMVIYQENIEEVSGGLGSPSLEDVETTVLNHEFGHVLGLVDVGTEMQADHKDPNQERGSHCDNDSCLMHYTARTEGIADLLIGGSVPELDQNCINDLQANDGR
ncbi:MAG: hypothetical protein WD491_01130 [Balneolales bacterium]